MRRQRNPLVRLGWAVSVVLAGVVCGCRIGGTTRTAPASAQATAISTRAMFVVYTLPG